MKSIDPRPANGPGEAVPIPGSSRIGILSAATGRRFELFTWSPESPPPAGGYPVLFSFDADTSFGMLVDAARTLNPAAAKAGLPPAMIVAIGYPADEGGHERRLFDMTPDAGFMPERPNGKPWPTLGGADAFLRAIEEDIRPVIRDRFSTGAETLFGHSLGGLMTLYRLLTKPDAFDGYVASSPSLWVNGGKLIDDFETALLRPNFPSAYVPLHLSVGAGEEDLTPWDVLDHNNLDARRKWVAANAMVARARRLADIIEADAVRNIALRFRVLPGHDHSSAKAVSAFEAVRVAIEHGAGR